MNQSQRKFLIEQIESERSAKVDALENKRTDRPEVGQYLLQAILTGNIQLKPEAAILKSLKKLAIRGTEQKDEEPVWSVQEASSDTSYYSRGKWRKRNSGNGSVSTITIPVAALFVIPDEYMKLLQDWKDQSAAIDKAIEEIELQSKSLITRIQLASNSTLAKLIAEVDDMGNLSFMDESLRLISRTEAGLPLLIGNKDNDDED